MKSTSQGGSIARRPGRGSSFYLLDQCSASLPASSGLFIVRHCSTTYWGVHLLLGTQKTQGKPLAIEFASDLPWGMFVRRCPTLPHRGRCSTIGAEGLSFRVRDGTGRFPFAMTAVTLWNYPTRTPWLNGCGCCSRTAQWTRSTFVVSPRPISTGQLKHLTMLPLPAYQPGGLAGGLTPLKGGSPHLGTGFPLRCFQRLSLPNVANQPCSWWNNWHTRGSSVPVLSY